MGILFGTDGIRGIANKYPMDCATLVNIGRAIAHYFCEDDEHVAKKKILIGCDTRVSKDMIVNAITSGICSMGTNVVFTGVLSTPGVAYLTREGKFNAGVVVSASHNKFYDNGIKIFDASGCKIDNHIETKLESMIVGSFLQKKSKENNITGQMSFYKESVDKYCNFLIDFCIDNSLPIDGIKVVLDCANGALSNYASSFLSRLGANVTSLFCSPNGININDHCGSEHPEALAKVVLDKGADLGLAFDGDGDRLIAVSELGEILTGDQLLAIFANDLKSNGLLRNNVVVSSIMSNLGLSIALKKMRIEHVKSKVGDKYVTSKMVQTGAILGGENSGHLILTHRQIRMGDALLAALKLIANIRKHNLPLSDLSKVIKLLPQYLINVNITSRPDLAKIGKVQDAISIAKCELGNEGRVFVRYSGTQKKCRVMVEGKELIKVKKLCRYIAKIIHENTN